MLTYAEALRILGLNPGANEREIKSAFRRLAQKYHPDKFPAGSAEQARAVAKFREIKEACDVAKRGQSPPPARQPAEYRPSAQRQGYIRRTRYRGPYHQGQEDEAGVGNLIRIGFAIFFGLMILTNIPRCVGARSEARIEVPEKFLPRTTDVETSR